jgi:nucleotide-binding universal stress UspA family protein
MKDFIIPVDFSEPSLNAVRYAAAMLSGKPDTHVILYHMFEDEEESGSAGQYLESLKNELLQKGVNNNIECVKEYGKDLIDCLVRLAYQKNAELIVMGISEKGEWKQLVGSSRAIKMAEQNICPVMIVPPVAAYTGIKNVALASDFKNVDSVTPVLAIKTILEMFSSRLHILNVDNEHYVSLTDEYQAEKGKLIAMFAQFKPEFYFLGINDFYEAVEQFCNDRNIDLLIVIPKNHTFTDRLFGHHHTKKLAFQSSVPILAAHE